MFSNCKKRVDTEEGKILHGIDTCELCCIRLMKSNSYPVSVLMNLQEVVQPFSLVQNNLTFYQKNTAFLSALVYFKITTNVPYNFHLHKMSIV